MVEGDQHLEQEVHANGAEAQREDPMLSTVLG